MAQALFVADVTLSLVFVAEYLFRVATAENRRGYVTSFFGIIDLVAISPILTSRGCQRTGGSAAACAAHIAAAEAETLR